ncbi:MAG: BON domain-containing protein [Planctomycetaceae bacterium]
MRHSIDRRSWILLSAFAAGLALPAIASAQSQSLFGNRGPASQIGSNARGSAVGSSGFGSTGGMAAGMGMGAGMGTGMGTGFGGMGGGASRGGSMSMTGMGATGMGATGMGMTGQTTGGFLGANNQGRVIGSQQGTMQGGMGLTGGMGRGGMQGLTGLGSTGALGRGGMQGMQGVQQRGGIGGMRQQQFGAAGGRGGVQQVAPVAQGRGGAKGQVVTIVNPRHQIAFSYPELEANSVRTALDARFESHTQRRSSLAGVRIAADSPPGVLVLRGEVESADAARLAVTMARLEPGVREVRSELTVRAQPPMTE